VDLATGDYLSAEPKFYKSGMTYTINKGLKLKIEDPDVNAAPQYLPKTGDYLTLYYSVNAVRSDGRTVTPLQSFSFKKLCATSDGVIFSMRPPDYIQSVSRIGGTDQLEMNFTVYDETAVVLASYQVATTGQGTSNGVGFVNLVITSSKGEVTVDSLFSGDTFDFGGIRGEVVFPEANPPAAGNLFAVETIVPIAPNLTDTYHFKIAGAAIHNIRSKSELDRIRVVPNPYLVSSLYEPEFGELRKEPVRQIQFINLPQECTIYIFTVAGDRVKTIEHQAPNGSESWDLRAEGGREIAPGVYLYLVKTKNAQYKNTFAVIK
jgi:hypothetical protein